MSWCPSCRQPTVPGATHCMHCRALLPAGPAAPPQGQGYGAPPAQAGYGAPPAQAGYGAPPQPQGYGAPPQPQGYGAPPAQGGYGAPPAQAGYGAPPPQQGYGAPPAQGGYGAPPAQQGYGAPPQAGPQAGYTSAPGGFGAPGPQPGYGAPAGYAGPGPAPARAPSTGMSGCGIAAIIGVVVALLGGVGLVILLVAVGASSSSSDDGPTAGPPPAIPASPSDEPVRDDIPDTGALRPLLKDRIGAYRLDATGEITRLGDALQGGVVDSIAAKYVAPNGAEVTLMMVVYANEAIATSKVDAVQGIARATPGNVVVRTQVLNKQRRVVGSRLRITGLNPQHVYWNNGKLLSFVTSAPPHAVGFEMAAPF